MNPWITVGISAGGLILSVLYQVWATANSQGKDKQSVLQISGQVAKLIEWNDDRIRFQAGTNEYITTQKEWNANKDRKIDALSDDVSKMKGREENRRN